ncbi:hypothetical protein WA158_007418 [Blastocystis sp. Blastoise]
MDVRRPSFNLTPYAILVADLITVYLDQKWNDANTSLYNTDLKLSEEYHIDFETFIEMHIKNIYSSTVLSYSMFVDSMIDCDDSIKKYINSLLKTYKNEMNIYEDVIVLQKEIDILLSSSSNPLHNECNRFLSLFTNYLNIISSLIKSITPSSSLIDFFSLFYSNMNPQLIYPTIHIENITVPLLTPQLSISYFCVSYYDSVYHQLFNSMIYIYGKTDLSPIIQNIRDYPVLLEQVPYSSLVYLCYVLHHNTTQFPVVLPFLQTLNILYSSSSSSSYIQSLSEIQSLARYQKDTYSLLYIDATLFIYSLIHLRNDSRTLLQSLYSQVLLNHSYISVYFYIFFILIQEQYISSDSLPSTLLNYDEFFSATFQTVHGCSSISSINHESMSTSRCISSSISLSPSTTTVYSIPFNSSSSSLIPYPLTISMNINNFYTYLSNQNTIYSTISNHLTQLNSQFNFVASILSLYFHDFYSLLQDHQDIYEISSHYLLSSSQHLLLLFSSFNHYIQSHLLSSSSSSTTTSYHKFLTISLYHIHQYYKYLPSSFFTLYENTFYILLYTRNHQYNTAETMLKSFQQTQYSSSSSSTIASWNYQYLLIYYYIITQQYPKARDLLNTIQIHINEKGILQHYLHYLLLSILLNILSSSSIFSSSLQYTITLYLSLCNTLQLSRPIFIGLLLYLHISILKNDYTTSLSTYISLYDQLTFHQELDLYIYTMYLRTKFYIHFQSLCTLDKRVLFISYHYSKKNLSRGKQIHIIKKNTQRLQSDLYKCLYRAYINQDIYMIIQCIFQMFLLCQSQNKLKKHYFEVYIRLQSKLNWSFDHFDLFCKEYSIVKPE